MLIIGLRLLHRTADGRGGAKRLTAVGRLIGLIEAKLRTRRFDILAGADAGCIDLLRPIERALVRRNLFLRLA